MSEGIALVVDIMGDRMGKYIPEDVERYITEFYNCHEQNRLPDYEEYCVHRYKHFRFLYSFLNSMEPNLVIEEPDGGELDEKYYRWLWVNDNIEKKERNRLYTLGKAAMRDIFSGNGIPISQNTNISKIKEAEEKHAGILSELNAKYKDWKGSWKIFVARLEMEGLNI